MRGPIEMILLRQWSSYLGLPVWIMDVKGSLIYYNEPAEAVLGRRFEDSGAIASEELRTSKLIAAEEFASANVEKPELAPPPGPLSAQLASRVFGQIRAEVG